LPDGYYLYCDVSLPVPLDQPFTYGLPDTLRHRVQPGCRVLVPFGSRRLTGVVLRCHDDAPGVPTRDAMRLIDAEPVLDSGLLALGKWISGYYCAPLGEVLRGMLPLASDIRRGKVYSLTDAGRDAARQLLFDSSPEDPVVQILRMLDRRPLSASYLERKLPLAANALRALERKRFVMVEQVQTERDPLRASSERLRVEAAVQPTRLAPTAKLGKPERELLAFLDLHPGSHNLKDLESMVRDASPAARALARKKLVTLRTEPVALNAAGPVRGPHTLNPPQAAAFEQIGVAIQAHEFHTFLLHGVTGSGKTEVYLNAIDAALACGRSALLLVPEIALTPAVAGQFFSRFGDRVAILHSAFSDSERSDQWRRIRSGAAAVVVATRSGVFAPMLNLGLIVVDEEHDQSYKQEETPRYNGRDVAIVRAQAARACVVLGSATPSLESRYNAERGKYTLLELPTRVEARPMPQVELIDMRTEFLETRKQATFSRRLLEAVAHRVDNGEQTIILLNRRDRRLLCHYCNYAERVPSHCPKCQSDHIYFIGVGSEKVEEELHREFPKARIARLDRDTASAKRQYEAILQGFREASYDILVGTQMVAKGHAIPNVTLVGVVSADVGLGLPDFRAAERTFQLLTQVAGRAGRGSLPGIVLIQTINPDHYAVRMAAAQDYQTFYEKELQFRRMMHYPPFSAMANILARSEQQEHAMRLSTELGRFLTPAPEKIKILGPAEAPVTRFKNEYRYQFLIKAASRTALNELLRRAQSFAREQKWSATALVIDVDPLTLL
jgi:primosomal protein N' (replication factor Y)